MPPVILIVDDEPTVRAFVSKILKLEGFEIVEACDGRDALEQMALRAAPVDLVLTDIRMPNMDGVELAQAVHSMYPRMPVLYISGYAFAVEEERAKYIGRPCGFVSKPFTRQMLIEAVQKCLEAPTNSLGATG